MCSLPGKVNTPSLPDGDDDDWPAEEWVVMDTVKSDQLGQPMRRLRERVCLAEYRSAMTDACGAMDHFPLMSLV